MAWKLCKISSGHLSLENDKLKFEEIFEVLFEIERKLENNSNFGNKLGIAPSAAAVELLIDSVRLTLGWDIWSGVFVMAWDDKGDEIIRNAISPIFL